MKQHRQPNLSVITMDSRTLEQPSRGAGSSSSSGALAAVAERAIATSSPFSPHTVSRSLSQTSLSSRGRTVSSRGRTLSSRGSLPYAHSPLPQAATKPSPLYAFIHSQDDSIIDKNRYQFKTATQNKRSYCMISLGRVKKSNGVATLAPLAHGFEKMNIANRHISIDKLYAPGASFNNNAEYSICHYVEEYDRRDMEASKARVYFVMRHDYSLGSIGFRVKDKDGKTIDWPVNEDVLEDVKKEVSAELAPVIRAQLEKQMNLRARAEEKVAEIYKLINAEYAMLEQRNEALVEIKKLFDRAKHFSNQYNEISIERFDFLHVVSFAIKEFEQSIERSVERGKQPVFTGGFGALGVEENFSESEASLEEVSREEPFWVQVPDQPIIIGGNDIGEGSEGVAFEGGDPVSDRSFVPQATQQTPRTPATAKTSPSTPRKDDSSPRGKKVVASSSKSKKEKEKKAQKEAQEESRWLDEQLAATKKASEKQAITTPKKKDKKDKKQTEDEKQTVTVLFSDFSPDQKVKSVMTPSKGMIPTTPGAPGTPKQAEASSSPASKLTRPTSKMPALYRPKK